MEAHFEPVKNDIGFTACFGIRLKIILFRLILILRAVFRRGHAGIFLKNIAEIMGVVIPRLIGDPGTLFVGSAKKFLGSRESEIDQVLRKCLPRVLGKNRGEPALAHIYSGRDILEHKVRVLELL